MTVGYFGRDQSIVMQLLDDAVALVDDKKHEQLRVGGAALSCYSGLLADNVWRGAGV